MATNPSDKLAPAPARTALAVPGAEPIHAALANAGYLDAVTQGSVNLVSPIFAVDSIPEGAKFSVRMVRVDQATETYSVGSGKLALLKVALDKIAGAAQVDWAFSGQVDDWNDPHRVKYHGVAIVRNPDGTLRRLPGTKVVDLRKTAEFTGEDAKGMSDRELAMARKHIHALAESKAMNRAVRKLGIPSAMPPEQIARPWIVVTLVPDMAHPEMRKAMIDSMAPSRALLYGHTQTEAPHALPSEIEAGEDTGETVDAPAEPVAPVPTEPELPPEEPAAPPCALPIAEETVIAAIQAGDGKRAEFLKAINSWCSHALKHMPPDAAQAMFEKFGNGFQPLTASTAEMAGLIGALKAEIAKMGG